MILNLFELRDQVAVVTGGLGLLGQQFSAALASAGARVAIVDVATQASQEIDSFRVFRGENRIRIYKADICKKGELSEVLQKVTSEWGIPSILVNNAAIDSPPNAPVEENGPFEDFPESSLDKVMNVNLKGVVFCCQVFGGAMAKAGRGSIINIASIYGLVSPNQDIYEFKRKTGDEWYKPVGYSITKSGILNFTRYLATYWAKKGVRVNTLTPAGIFNKQDPAFLEEYLKRMPLGRMANPDEMNGAVLFLASKASSYMTGSNLVIDGGWTAW